MLKLGNVEFNSRLILGTGKFSNTETMVKAIEASGTDWSPLPCVALTAKSRTMISAHRSPNLKTSPSCQTPQAR